jgi:hypothetical protein
MKILSLFSFSIIALLTSCVRPISVQTQYLGRENLASFHITTPDPNLEKPDIGQRLVIEWSLPSYCMTYSDLIMEIRVRLKNREEQKIELTLNKPSGIYLYSIVNEAYKESGGIVTYKVDILGDGQVIESWKHPLWVELILFKP